MKYLLSMKVIFAVFATAAVITAGAHTKWFKNLYFSLIPYREGIVGLGTFQEEKFDEILRDHDVRLVLYFIERETFRAVRVNLASKEVAYGTDKHEDRFPCLIVRHDESEAPRISSCTSKSRYYDYERLDIDSRLLFDDEVNNDEVDSSKFLKDGKNYWLKEVYKPYSATEFDAKFLRIQKIGSSDLIASCSGLQLIAPDRIGAVNFYVTKIRPHARGALAAGVGNADALTHKVLMVHLKNALTTGYQCDSAITLPSDLVIVVSGTHLLAIDPTSQKFGVAILPATPLNSILFRVVR